MAGGRRGPGALVEPRRLMRTGLGLIVLGHGSLVLGAIVHGSVLRHVAGARRAVTPEYAAANVVSVCSGLLVSVAGPGGGGGPCPARALLSAGLPAEHRRGNRRHPGVAQPVPGGPGECGAAGPSGQGGSARPCPAGSRSPGPWPRGLLPCRRRLPALQVSPVPGSAPLAAPGGWEQRVHRPRAEALRWAKLQPGWGSRVASQGGQTRGGMRRAGLRPGLPALGQACVACVGVSTEPEGRGAQRCQAHQGVKDAKDARASSEGKA